MKNERFEEQYRRSGLASQRRYPNEQLVQFLAGNFFHIPPEARGRVRILEIGCGSGANLWMVAREGFDAFGVDIAETGLELCRSVLDEWDVSAQLSVMDMRTLEYADSTFDAIFDVVSMQHCDLAGHRAAYREVLRCLKPGGRFFQWHLGAGSVSFAHGGGVPTDPFTVDDIRNPEVPLAGNGMTCFLPTTDARTILESAGFVGVSVERHTRTYRNMTQVMEYLAVTAGKP